MLAVDCVIMYITVIRGYNFDNWYYDLHKRFGLLKVTIAKLIFCIVQVYLLFNPPVKYLGPVFISWIYFAHVLICFINFIKAKDSAIKDSETVNNNYGGNEGR